MHENMMMKAQRKTAWDHNGNASARMVYGRPRQADIVENWQYFAARHSTDFVFPDFRMADRQDPGLPYMWDSGMDGGPPGGTSSDVPQMDASSGIPTSFPYGSNRLKSPHLNRPMSVPPPSAHMYNPQVPRSLDNPIPAHGGPMGISTSAPTASSTSSPLVVPHPVKMTRTNKTYHCRMCDQIFDSKSDLLVHSQHVHKQDPKPYKCPTCNKCFANSSYLSQHNRIHAGIKPYKCQICERKFTQLCHLQQHMRTHTGEKPYKCQHPGCGKAFTQLSNLQSHSRSHMTDKPYRCNSCYKCYTDEQGLREHIPKHSETKHLKTHICHICGKSYTQETYLTRHMQKHSFDQSGRNQMTNAQSKLVQGIGQPDITELKSPQLDGLVTSPTDSPRQSGSAFMPLGHQYPGHNMINSSVPSNFPFPPPRIPQSTLSSPLPHISSVSTSRPYFPFDPVSFPKREPMERSIARDGNMIANSLLSLQQIKTFSQSHGVSSSHASAVFPKSEPSSPVHKDF